MQAFVHRLTIVGATAGGIVTAASVVGAVAQGTDSAANPIPARPSIPPLQLSDPQRVQIRAAVDPEDSDVRFQLKETKAAASFKPAVGAKLPKQLQPHPLPRPLIYQMPILKQYTYVKVCDQILIVNPLTKEIVDMFPQS